MREQSFKNANNSRPNDIRGGETKVMKKLLTSFLVLALLLSIVTPAFANTTQEDLGDYATAVSRLGALEILKGYSDGTFRVDNTITRAEFAAVAVRLLGLEASAKAAQGPTQFKDAVDTWATGYINIAAQQGILTGYTDGTIRATNPVTQAEALAMLIRVLGYEPSVAKQGWPFNYVVKAQQIGLSADLDVAANANASRGFVAQASDNALFIDKMVQTGVILGEPTYSVVENNTLLSVNLNVSKKNGVVVANENADFSATKDAKAGQVVIAVEGTDSNGNAITTDTVYNIGTTNAKELVGYKVSFYAKSGNLVYAEKSGNTVLTVEAADIDSTTLTAFDYLDANGDVQTVDITSAKEVFNGKNKTLSAADLAPLSGNVVLVNVDSDEAYEYAIVTSYSTLSVDEVLVDDEYIVGKDADLDLSGTNVKYTIVKDGVEVSLSDLKEWDVLEVVESADQLLYTIYVVNDVVTGTVEEFKSATQVVIGGTTYKVADDENTGLTFNSSVVGSKGTFYLDIDGKIFEYKATATATASNYGYLVTVADADAGLSVNTQFKLVKADGTTAVFNGASKIALNGTSKNENDVAIRALSAGMVKYELNSDGEISIITEQAAVAGDTSDGLTTELTYASKTKKLGNYVLTNDTLVFFVKVASVGATTTGAETGDYGVFTIADLENAESYNAEVYGVSSTLNASVVLVKETSFTGVTTNSTLAFVDKVTSALNADGDTVAKLYAYVNGQKVEYLAANGVSISASKGDLIEIKFNTKDEVASVESTVFDAGTTATGTVDAKSSTVIVVDGTSYALAASVQVYEWDTANSTVGTSTYTSIKADENSTSPSDVFVKTNTDGLVELIIIVK